MNMYIKSLETHELPGGLVEVPEYNIFDESQNSKKYCKKMRREINLSYEKLKKIYREQIENLPEKTRKDVELLLNEKCRDGNMKYATSPVGFVKNLLDNMKSSSEKRKHSPPEIKNNDQMRKFVDILMIENQGKFKDRPLILRSGHPNSVSMERVDESEGYTLRNMLMVTKDYQVGSQKLKESTVILDVDKEKIRNGDTFDPKPRDTKLMKLDKNGNNKIYQVKWDYHSKVLDDARIDFLMKYLPEGIYWSSSQKFYMIRQDGKYVTSSTPLDDVSKKEKFKEIFEKYLKHDMSADRETEYYVCIESKKTKSGRTCKRIHICSHCEKKYMTTNMDAFKRHEVACCLPECMKGSCQMGEKKCDLFKKRFNHAYGPELFGKDSEEREKYIDKLIGDYILYEEESNLYRVLLGKARACIAGAKRRDLEAEEEEKFVDILFWIVFLYRLRCMYSGIKGSLDELHYAFALSVERINPDEGYVEGNIALVCREFNTGHNTQMTHKKFKEVYGWNPEWVN